MIPNDKILIETDSPYLSPEPLRGRRNDPNELETANKATANMYIINPFKIFKIE